MRRRPGGTRNPGPSVGASTEEEGGEGQARSHRADRDHFFFDDFFPFFFDVFLDVLRAAFLAAMCSVTPFCTLTLGIRLKASVLNRASEGEVGGASREARQGARGASETVRREPTSARQSAGSPQRSAGSDCPSALSFQSCGDIKPSSWD